ncbi:MAG: hypothetical protein COT33_01360 [Candidatus Nealsonbacteria bacterium CG08_land_8_20_14_0_20_38_20]|uniref:PIN domain-containing protein n=1 Tax=Candidatus Nealsonbacteria bacterium CG08_land_8_20_14_0_20_38_20 TaxID=1974705 RepID=A0A2H0YP73_9BACT|nr:MAG: hypothetical protein COT33_01360 [Candidatus Nealsonbacteria bacterium CG08_land_8_20_14_0_20_38_20]
MASYTIDSSVFISAFNQQDVFHKQTKEFFDCLGKMDFEIILPISVIAEVGNILIKNRKIKDTLIFLDYFYEFTVIEFNYEFLLSAFPVFRKFKLKTGDILAASTAYLYKAVLISWDKQLLKQSKKLVASFTPDEFCRQSFS